MSVDPRASRAWRTGADEYESHRPGWPPEAVERALSALGLEDGATVVDLAAGTGKLTRVLAPRAARVVAVEPLDDMRRRIAAAAPGAEVVEGAAQDIPLDDACADALFAAEAFHWFAGPDAVAEIARVVRPGGGIVLLWNLHDWGPEPWLEGVGGVMSDVLAGVLPSANRHEPENWEHAFEGSPFGPFERFHVRHEQRTDVAGLIGHILTWSYVRALDDARRARLTADLDDVLRRDHPSPDDVVLPYRTEVHWARRT
ncbi:MAG TPA: class I SAM-dependent methyltransferase [Thermoleophilaceae bacterium]|jgi:SAM-dependent methyltransferase